MTVAGRETAGAGAERGRWPCRAARAALAAVTFVLPLASVAGPRLEIEYTKVDFGRVVRGETPKGVVRMRNTGDADLVIEKGKTPCHCVHYSYDKTIPPGGTGELRLEVETARVSGDVMRRLSLFSNDPVEPIQVVEVRIEVLASVVLLPKDYVYVSNAKDELNEPVLLVRKDSREEGELVVREVGFSVPWLDAEVRRLEEPELFAEQRIAGKAGDWVIRLRPRPGAPYGGSTETLRFATGLAYEPVVEVPVQVRLNPALRPSEQSIVLRPVPGGAEGSVVLRVRPTLDPAAIVAESSTPSLAVEMTPLRDQEVKVRVTWSGEGPAEGEVVFRIGDESRALPVELEWRR